MSDLTCGKCTWYDNRRPDGGTNDDSGICRAYGPTVSHVSTVEATEEGGISNKIQILTHWPKVVPDFDFCPKYDPRKRTAAKKGGQSRARSGR